MDLPKGYLDFCRDWFDTLEKEKVPANPDDQVCTRHLKDRGIGMERVYQVASDDGRGNAGYLIREIDDPA